MSIFCQKGSSRNTSFSFQSTPTHTWLKQFSHQEEKALANLLVSKIQYWGPDEIRDGVVKLHHQLITQEVKPDNSIYTYFGNAKSGGLIAYYYRQANHLPSDARFERKGLDHFIDWTQLKQWHPSAEKPNIVLLDDGIQRGKNVIQYLEILSEQNPALKQSPFYVAVLSADPSGVRTIEESARKMGYQRLNVLYVAQTRKLGDPENTDFSEKQTQQLDQVIRRYLSRFPERLEEVYHKGFAKYYNTFYFNSPANTIPLLQYDYPNVWKGLFKRFWGQANTQRGEARPFRVDNFATKHLPLPSAGHSNSVP
jgi:hypothetical protein